jgi:hypothetical protein
MGVVVVVVVDIVWRRGTMNVVVAAVGDSRRHGLEGLEARNDERLSWYKYHNYIPNSSLSYVQY